MFASPLLPSQAVHQSIINNTRDFYDADVKSRKRRSEKLILSKPKQTKQLVTFPGTPALHRLRSNDVCPVHLFYARPAVYETQKREIATEKKEEIEKAKNKDRVQKLTSPLPKEKRRKRTKNNVEKGKRNNDKCEVKVEKRKKSVKKGTTDHVPIYIPGVVLLNNDQYQHLSTTSISIPGVNPLSVGICAVTVDTGDAFVDNRQQALSRVDFDELQKLRGLWTPTFYCPPTTEVRSPKMRYAWKDDARHAIKQLERYNVIWITNYLKGNFSCPDEPRDIVSDRRAVAYHARAIKSIHKHMHLPDIMERIREKVAKGQ